MGTISKELERLDEQDQELKKLNRTVNEQRTAIEYLQAELERHRSKDGRSVDVSFLHASPECFISKDKKPYQMDLLDLDRELKGIKHTTRGSWKGVQFERVLGTFDSFE